ncbi:hypothetical protein TDB9533_04374 [Thalassocella blandensis]|nr:hypothetical protein TDB9533_04374 [Thalassocella blandensis]
MKTGFFYSKNEIPSYECPLCQNGTMLPEIEGMFVRQTGESIALSKLDKSCWEESFHTELLRVDMCCSNQECGEVGVLIMLGELFPPDEHQSEAEVFFRPIFVTPAPLFFKLEDEYPISINKIAKEAFSLFWSDPAACGNKIRVGVEVLMNEQGIDKECKDKNGIPRLSKKGRPKPISLHNRIEEFKKLGSTKSVCASALESIKWLGNESSHSNNEIIKDVVYRAIMVFGAVLAQLYKNTPLDKEVNYSIKNINFWYHPDEQKKWPQT